MCVFNKCNSHHTTDVLQPEPPPVTVDYEQNIISNAFSLTIGYKFSLFFDLTRSRSQRMEIVFILLEWTSGHSTLEHLSEIKLNRVFFDIFLN